MHIGINLLSFKNKLNGMSTYGLNLVKELNRQLPDCRFTLFLPMHSKGVFPETPRMRKVYLPAWNLPVRIFVEQFVLPFFVLFLRCDLLHSTANVAPLILGAKNIVTIHDIYYVHFPKRFNILKLNYLRLVVRFSAMLSKKVIAVSNFTRNDLINFRYIKNRGKTRVIYEGVEMPRKGPADEREIIIGSCGASTPFFLFVSTIEPGKNLLNLIKAFSLFREKYTLAVVGAWGWGYDDILEYLDNNPEVKNRVVFTGHVAEETLAALYCSASALVMPSFHEGFGLPVIEAMYFNCPVCCSDGSSLTEVAGDAAIKFDPYSVEEIARALEDVQKPEIRDMLITKGVDNIKRFSWKKCASETLEVYNAVREEK